MYIDYKSKRPPVKLAYSLHDPENNCETQNGTCENAVPIVIIPCVFGLKENWKVVADKLSILTNRKVYVLDPRNHGESPHHPNGDYYDMAADVEHFLENRKIPKCHLLGHSMGGRTAMMVALTKPRLVESLICIDISPFSEPNTICNVVRYYATSMKNVLRDLPRDMTDLEEAKAYCIEKFDELNIESPMRDFLASNLVLDEDSGYRWLVNHDFLFHRFEPDNYPFPLFDHTKGFKGPSKFIFAETSEYIKLPDYLQLYKSFPEIDISTIQGTDHHIFADQPQKFVESISEFLGQLNVS